MIYFTADPHLGHKSIIKMMSRPFESTEEMDEEVLHQYNKTVDRKDTLIIVGDFCWKDHNKYRSRIRCKNIHLIWGNHDRPKYADAFGIAKDVASYKIGPADKQKQKIWCSHYPHCFWPASHYGSLHVYGHHHYMREEYLDAIWPERRSMDVGVDVAYEMFDKFRPFSEIEIYDRLMSRSGHDPLDFYKDFQEKRRQNGSGRSNNS